MKSNETIILDQLIEIAKKSPKSVEFISTYLLKEKRDIFYSLLNEASVVSKKTKEKTKKTMSLSGVITVTNDPRLTAELSVIMCKKFKTINVAVLDVDRLNPTLDIYFNAKTYVKSVYTHLDYKRTTGLNLLFDALHKHSLTKQYVQHLSTRVNGYKNLDYFSGSYLLEDYEYFSIEAYKKLLYFLEQTYDVVILNVNDFMYDAFTCHSLMASDINLIGIEGHMVSIRKMKNMMSFLEEKQKISKRKNIFVAMNYNKNFDMAMDIMRDHLKQPLIGIKYSRWRRLNLLNHYPMIRFVPYRHYKTLIKLIKQQLKK